MRTRRHRDGTWDLSTNDGKVIYQRVISDRMAKTLDKDINEATAADDKDSLLELCSKKEPRDFTFNKECEYRVDQ